MNLFKNLKLFYIKYQVKKQGDIELFTQHKEIHGLVSRVEFAKLLSFHRYGLRELKKQNSYILHGQINLDDYIHRPDFILEILRYNKTCFWSDLIYEAIKIDKNFLIKFFLLVKRNSSKLSHSYNSYFNHFELNSESLNKQENFVGEFEKMIPQNKEERNVYFKKLFKYSKLFFKNEKIYIDYFYINYMPLLMHQYMDKLPKYERWTMKSITNYLSSDFYLCHKEYDNLTDVISSSIKTGKKVKI